jgi:serine/threonine protein kinase
MAEVYRAAHLGDNFRLVAVKILTSAVLDQDELAETFKRETRALRALHHPGIVELIDAGTDEATGKSFLVLEWMESNLSEWAKRSPPADWDSFYQAVGRDILEALAFAHAHDVAHRDLKPANILIDKDGRAKLGDFGISKLTVDLQPGLTLRDFMSRPYTPPEVDDGEFTLSRDVFGFGAIALACLSGENLTCYDDIPKALSKFRGPSPVADLITRMVSRDPAERPPTADVLVTELRAIQPTPAAQLGRRPCFLEFVPNGLHRLGQILHVDSSEEVQRHLLQDLNQECGVRPKVEKDGVGNAKYPEDHYTLFGVSYQYHVKVGDPRDHLVVSNASPASSAALERQRDKAWRAPYDFRAAAPRNRAEASAVIEELELAVSDHEASARAERQEEEEQRLFRVWNACVQLKSDAERRKETLLVYQSFEAQGQFVVFRLRAPLPDAPSELLGQGWRVKFQAGGALGGEVAVVDGDRLHLDVKYGEPNKLPTSGALTFDISLADRKLKRERTALDAVRFERAARPDLGRLLCHPEAARKPTPFLTVDFRQELDAGKQDAIRVALGSDDFLVVEGPPGTGKTRLIAELVLQYLKLHPTARVLVTSQTHVAVDNAIERVAALDPNLKIVRIGRSGDPRISRTVEPLMLEHQLHEWRKEIGDRGERFLASWAQEHGVSRQDVELSATLRRLSVVLEAIENSEAEFARLEEDDALGNVYSAGQVLARQEELAGLRSTLASLRRDRKALHQELRDLGCGELAGLTRDQLGESAEHLLGHSPDAARFVTLMKIQAEWLQGFGKGRDFDAALLARSQVVSGTCLGMAAVPGSENLEFDLCILDEASKATPTEALVPMARSHSWVLVGDPRQLPPFQDESLRAPVLLQDYNLAPADLKDTIFNHLLARLPSESRRYLGVQHRMVKPIGSLISHCFYPERGLQSVRTERDPLVVPVLPHAVTWLTTARLANRKEQRIGTSFLNRAEVNATRQLLNRLNAALLNAGREYQIAVLTGYAEQRRAIENSIAADRSTWRALSVECNTIDAIQGREAEIAIYSVTRSNEDKKLGHLRETERLNVALSRGAIGLVIVGDHLFCREILWDNPLGRVLKYIEDHPPDCALSILAS